MAPAQLALLGTGGRGQIYVDVLERMEPGRAQWAAMVGRTPSTVANFCEENVLDCPQVIGPEKLQQMDGVDAVLVCTPDYAHREPAVACFEAGKHCLVEKPLATNPDDAAAICEAAREAAKILHLGFVLRYDPLAMKMRELVQGGAIGKPIAAIVHEAIGWFHGATYMRRWNRFREKSGDMLLHKGCHTLDIINFILGAYPTRVAAMGGTDVFTPREDAADFCHECNLADECIYYTDQGEEYRKRFYETAGPQVLPEDMCVYNVEKTTTDNTQLVAQFDNGMRLSYTMTMVSPQGDRRMTIIGTDGELRTDMHSYEIEYMPLPDRDTEVIEVEPPEGWGHQHHDLALLTHFLDRIDRDEDPEEGIQDAWMSGAIAFAALESMETGEFVDIERV
jgi:predicted dehydrogenase